MKCCWGENCAIFFLNAGIFSVFAAAWTISAVFPKSGETAGGLNGVPDLFDKPILAGALISLVLLWGALTPLSYGVKWYRLQQVRGISAPARGIFGCYLSLRKFGQVFRLNILLTARKLCVIIPLAAADVLAYAGVRTVSGEGFAAAAALILAAAFLCFYIMLTLRYAPVPYLYALEPDTPPAELFGKGRRLMSGKTKYLARVMLSAAWIAAACLFVFPSAVLVPYARTLYTAALNEIICADR